MKKSLQSCLIILVVIVAGCSAPQMKQDQAAGALEAIGDYGNWCGGDNSGPGDPINPVDYVCYQHDKCIENNKTNCTCDFDFRDRMAHLANIFTTTGTMGKFGKSETLTVEMKAYASAAGPAVMIGHACNCHHKELSWCKGPWWDPVGYPCSKFVTTKTFDADACLLIGG